MIHNLLQQSVRLHGSLPFRAMNRLPLKQCILISAVALLMPFQGCKTTPKEVKYQDAQPGDVLVVSDNTMIELSHPFKEENQMASLTGESSLSNPTTPKTDRNQCCLQHARSPELA